MAATFRRRVLARLLDTGLLAWFALALAYLFAVVTMGDRRGDSATTDAIAEFVLSLLIAPLLFVTYQVAFLTTLGATPGMLVMRIRVVSGEGQAIGIRRSLIRTLAEFPGLVIDPLWAITHHPSSGVLWHDHVAKTRALRESPTDRLTILGRAWPRAAVGAGAAGLFLLGGCVACLVAPGVSSWTDQFTPEVNRYIRAGIESSEMGNHSMAASWFTLAIKADSRSSLAYTHRGDAFGHMGHRAQQITDYSRAIELDSTQVWAYLGRADAYREQEQLPESSSDYSAVIRLRPDWSGLVFAYRGRGALHYRQGDFANAAKDFGEGHRIAMNHYLGTSDFSKGQSFRDAIAMCVVFRCEALHRMGQDCTIDDSAALEWSKADGGKSKTIWLEE